MSLMVDKQSTYEQEVEYNVGDNLTANCGIPRYGFSDTPTLTIARDGIEIEKGTHRKRFE